MEIIDWLHIYMTPIYFQWSISNHCSVMSLSSVVSYSLNLMTVSSSGSVITHVTHGVTAYNRVKSQVAFIIQSASHVRDSCDCFVITVSTWCNGVMQKMTLPSSSNLSWGFEGRSDGVIERCTCFFALFHQIILVSLTWPERFLPTAPFFRYNLFFSSSVCWKMW